MTTCLVCGAAHPVASPVAPQLLMRCPECGFSWTAGMPAPAAELYDSSYFEGEGYADYYDSAARISESRLRLRWLQSTGRVTSLVEAGSAGGYFVSTARAAGIDACGVEISQSAVDHARNELGVPVDQGNFEVAEFPQPVDAVCAFHVLEHVEDPGQFLAAARAALRPGGRLALEVPNIAAAAASRLGPLWPNIEPQYHRWHFTPDSLRRFVADAGFEVLTTDTIFSRFYWRGWGRVSNARSLFIADLVASRSPRVSHPELGDLLRIVARRPVERPAASAAEGRPADRVLS